MPSILDIIATETHGSSFKTYKYGFDGIEVPRFDYDDHQYHFTWKRYGETESHKKTVPLGRVVDQIAGTEPLFHYFLDGSRKTYKVDDMSYRNQVYPIIAGQVGVGCCLREQGEISSDGSNETFNLLQEVGRSCNFFQRRFDRFGAG